LAAVSDPVRPFYLYDVRKGPKRGDPGQQAKEERIIGDNPLIKMSDWGEMT